MSSQEVGEGSGGGGGGGGSRRVGAQAAQAYSLYIGGQVA